MIKFEPSINCYNVVNQDSFHLCTNTNTLSIFPFDIKQEFHYSYSESSSSGSCESKPSTKSPNQKRNNVNFCIESNQDQENGDFSDSAIDSIDDDYLMGRSLHFLSSTVNRGGRRQVKQGTTKRNARERNRVRYINNCFEVLKRHLPFELFVEEKNRKLSKVETLKFATIYIKKLTDLLNYEDIKFEESFCHKNLQRTTLLNEYNTNSLSYDLNCFHKKERESIEFQKKMSLNNNNKTSNILHIKQINNNKIKNKNNLNVVLSSSPEGSPATNYLLYTQPNTITNYSFELNNCGQASLSSAFY